jgi:predicted permease
MSVLNGGIAMLSILFDELRQALRALVARPAFSALVVGVLASGLACVIFMLVMIDGFLIRPLPFVQPEHLLHVGVSDGGNDGRPQAVSGRDLLQLRKHLAGKGEVAGFESATINLSDLDRPERFDGAVISANLWRVLGVAPLLGRDFSTSDAAPGAARVVLLSHALWQSRYGGDPGIIGRSVRVNAAPGTVVGVMPPDLSYPFREVVWIPATLTEDTLDADNTYDIVVRRSSGVDAAAIDAAVAGWFADAAKADPQRLRGLHSAIEPLAYYSVSRTTRTVLGIMLVAVFLVLLVACANAANLLLLRTLSRRQELAVRVALGASRARIAAHLLAQALVLAAAAAAVALPLAHFAVQWQAAGFRASANGPPLWLRFDLDATVIALALGAALLTALATGLLPALRAGRDTVAASLRDGARGSAGGAFVRLTRALVIGEVALSCALLIVVGTMIRGIVALDHLDPGFDSSHLLSARIGLFSSTYPSGADQIRLYDKLSERLREDPEVLDASVATALPMRLGWSRDVLPAGTPAVGDAALPKVRFAAVDDRFLATYDVRLLRGRFFDHRDSADGERVAVVDRTFAQKYAGGGDVIGRRFKLDPRNSDGPTVTVVGVFAALRLDNPGDVPHPDLLVPLRQEPARFVSLVVRLHGDPNAFAPRLNAIMRTVDPDTPLYWVRDFAAVLAEATFGEHVVAQLFAIFGAIALILAGAGLYGITAFSVGQRTREIGVRRALGAPARQVLRHLFTRTGWQLALGIVAGIVVGVPLAQVLTGSLQTINGVDALTPLIALAILAAAGLLAVLVPARRALRIDPTEALRHE